MAGGGISQGTNTGAGQGFGPGIDNYSGGFGTPPALPQNMTPGFGGMGTPFHPTLPVNTTSTQANAVLDPYAGPKLNFGETRDMKEFARQQRFITDPYQQMMNQQLLRQSAHNLGLHGGQDQQQYLANNYTALPTTFGGRYRNVDYTRLAKPKDAFYQMNPAMGIAGLLG